MSLQTEYLMMIVFNLFLIHRVCATLDALKTLGYNWKHILERFLALNPGFISVRFIAKQSTCSVCADFLMNVWMHFTRCSSMSWCCTYISKTCST